MVAAQSRVSPSQGLLCRPEPLGDLWLSRACLLGEHPRTVNRSAGRVLTGAIPVHEVRARGDRQDEEALLVRSIALVAPLSRYLPVHHDPAGGRVVVVLRIVLDRYG